MLTAFAPVIYLQISPEHLTIKNLKTGEAITEVPEMAIGMGAGASATILAAGPQARAAAAASPGARVVNPFAHPRSMVSDFALAEQLIKYYLRRVQSRSSFFLQLAPVVLIHPLGSPAGGFTQVERRAFREMALGAGASEVVVWTGRVLTDQEARARKFPPGEGEAE
jgi:rod shape-determining protein MreB